MSPQAKYVWDYMSPLMWFVYYKVTQAYSFWQPFLCACKHHLSFTQSHTHTGDIWPQLRTRGCLREGGELKMWRQPHTVRNWTLAPIDGKQRVMSGFCSIFHRVLHHQQPKHPLIFHQFFFSFSYVVPEVINALAFPLSSWILGLFHSHYAKDSVDDSIESTVIVLQSWTSYGFICLMMQWWKFSFRWRLTSLCFDRFIKGWIKNKHLDGPIPDPL